jgi:hypothetical protein
MDAVIRECAPLMLALNTPSRAALDVHPDHDAGAAHEQVGRLLRGSAGRDTPPASFRWFR